jgi:hypothetical protein
MSYLYGGLLASNGFDGTPQALLNPQGSEHDGKLE